ncbi:hypothetical protein KHA80_14605 [Anaerobacillus sp. HL2]|nr:hypothetical protein KHA80_14605 [Anaerobacillus sp. HL2]
MITTGIEGAGNASILAIFENTDITSYCGGQLVLALARTEFRNSCK